ncbi:MAG: hypothetical protein IKQ03_05685 [Prevotella sp.]|nr:hypothetical protein [Prevotella sp.]
MDKKVDEARQVLIWDLENNPHILSAPLGHGVTSKKIHEYLYVCVLTKIPKSDCVDWLYELYNEQTDDERAKFQQIIDSIACCLYGFYDYLNNNRK